MTIHRYDVVVLGAGPGGEAAAGMAAEAGLETAIVEQHLVGGECSYYACIPSKVLLRPSALLAEVERATWLDGADRVEIVPRRVLDRRDAAIGGLDDSGQLPWLRERSVDLFRGHGVISGEREVRLGDEVLVADRAVIVATGSAAAVPPVEGFEQIGLWNNRDATTATTVPDRLIVLGGGPVGCELAQAWASLGSSVTLIEMAPRLLSGEEPFAGKEVEQALRERFGVTVITGAEVTAASSGDGRGGQPELELRDGRTVTGTALLVATGRMPHTDRIGLESVGTGGGGFLETDDAMRVKPHDWLYAIGDVNGRTLLTHAAKYQAWVATRAILGRAVPPEAERLGMPRVTFTDPQVAAAGLTLDQARAQGHDATSLDVPTADTPGASLEGKDAAGTCRLVVDRDNGRILGATFCGFGVAEWIHAATIAIVTRTPMDQMRHAVPAFPTRSEIWLRLQEKWEEESAGRAPAG